MGWKEFFKPNLMKIIVCVIIFLLLPIPILSRSCYKSIIREDWIGEVGGGYECLEYNPSIDTLNWEFGIRSLLSSISNDGILIIYSIILITLSYLFSCIIIYAYQKFKK